MSWFIRRTCMNTSALGKAFEKGTQEREGNMTLLGPFSVIRWVKLQPARSERRADALADLGVHAIGGIGPKTAL